MIEEQEDAKNVITAVGENFSSVFRETALRAVAEMPMKGTHKEQSKFIWHFMGNAHPEIAWGCEAVKRFTGTWANTTKMWYSSKASHVLTIKVGEDLSFRLFALLSKDD